MKRTALVLLLSSLLSSIAFAQSAAPAAVATDEPSTIVVAGIGGEGLGPVQIFGFSAVMQHVAAKTYLGASHEAVRMPGGAVGISAHAELTNVLYKLGRVWIGVTGGAGLAEGATGSASGSLSAAGFASCRCFGSWPAGFTMTAQTVTIAGTGDKPRFRFGLWWSF